MILRCSLPELLQLLWRWIGMKDGHDARADSLVVSIAKGESSTLLQDLNDNETITDVR